MKVSKSKIFWLIPALFVISVIAYWQFDFQTTQTTVNLSPSQLAQNQVTEQEIIPEPLTPRSEYWLSVPFTPQAPTANWDELHNEACEEASAIIAASFLSQDSTLGKSVNIIPKYSRTKNPPDPYDLRLDPVFVESEIDKLTNWQTDNFGYHLSIDTYETAKMIEAVYNLKAEVIPFDVETLERTYLSGDKIIIVPANGQLLNNPNYKQPGPKYHMLVITGYNPTQFITNDPGTRNGYNYTYDKQILENAVGNWDHNKQEVDLSNKLMIIISH